jgi:hypothetical protein
MRKIALAAGGVLIVLLGATYGFFVHRDQLFPYRQLAAVFTSRVPTNSPQFIVRQMAAFVINSAQADSTDNSLQIYVVQMLQGSEQSLAGAGVYLGNGLVITASHVAGPDHPGVRIGGLNVSAKMVKGGSFEATDLALFSMAEEKLPMKLRLRRLPLCQKAPEVDAPAILAAPGGITRSRIVSPLLLSPDYRIRFPTLISDIETSGKSGSGVFDAERKCLHGILSAKISNNLKQAIGTYFVPASTIQSFVPDGARW